MKLDQAQREAYQSQGFLVLPQLLDSHKLDWLRDECMSVWLQEKGEFDPGAPWLKNALLPNVHHLSERVCDYYFNGPLVDVAEQLIGPNIKGATSQLTFKLRGNTQTFGWHQDNGYGQLEPSNAVSALTALDSADRENGCLWVIPGSHARGQIDVSQFFTSASKSAGLELNLQVDEQEAIPLELQEGDAVIFHCHLLHCSQGNHSNMRDRRILFLRYADADAVEVYNDRVPRLGPLLRGKTQFEEVAGFERDLVASMRRNPGGFPKI